MEISWGRHPDKERVVLRFEGELPQEMPRRIGSRELILISALPQGESRPAPFDPSRSTLVESLEVTDAGVFLRTRTEAFGYLSFTLTEKNRLVVDLFSDELGARWRPEHAQASGHPQASSSPAPSAGDQPPALPEVTPSSEPSDPTIQHLVPEQAAPGPLDAPSTLPEEEQPTQQTTDPGQVRAKVRHVEARDAPVINPGSGEEFREALSLVPDQTGPEPTAQLPDVPPEISNSTVDRPADAVLSEGMAHLERGEWAEAAVKLETELKAGLGPREQEQAAYGVAEALFRLHGANPEGNFERMIRALQRAMNIGPNAPEYPHALFAAGDIQLRVGNEPEARAYFSLLRRRYPDHPDVPRSYYSWGEHYLAQGQWEKSAEALQTVVQEYPESGVVRQAAVSLVKALKESGFFDQALGIADFVNKRWPRYYMEDQEFLRLEGIIAMELGKFDLARRKLWTNYNLVPEEPGADLVMTRLGDIYLLEGLNEKARYIYEIVAMRYPGHEGGLIASMRLAEQGIFDAPSVVEMFSIFNRPEYLSPQAVYTRITDEFPDSPLAAVAQLKLAMWLLWTEQPEQSVDAVALLRERFPDAALWPRALEVAGKAFESWLDTPFKAKKFDEILAFWNRYPFLRETLPSLDAEGQLAMALTLWTTGSLDGAHDIAERVMEDSRYRAEERSTAFGLYLTIAADRQHWEEIISLEERGSVLPLRPKDQAQLRYALALAHENLGRTDESRKAWDALALDPELRPTQQGYAFFFMGRNAYTERDLDKAYHFSQRALSLFLQDDREKERIRDCLDLLIEISDQTGRTMKALEWAHEYEKMIPEGDPDWPSFQYRLARLYKAGGDFETWRLVLGALARKVPEGIYGKMAAADLRDNELQKRTQEFR
jgi:TolA-binding protein